MTISSVATALLPGSGEPTSGDGGSGATGLGELFAGLLGSGATPDEAPGSVPPGSPLPAEDTADATASGVAGPGLPGVPELLSAAQVMAAAQVVPVTPVLAAAVSLQGQLGTAPPAAPSTFSTTLPTGSTAVSAGDPVPPAVPPSAVPLAAPAATEPAAGTTTTAPSATTSERGASAQQGDSAAPSQPGQTGSLSGTSLPTAPVSAPTARAEGPAPAQVTGQVFPEVGRLVSRGDGTRRITLKLSPEALGEVRVVLTVRDGDVHVRMAGSELAQQALRAGAPELQRLLDLAGASSSSVVVGDQGTSDGGPGTDRSAQQEAQREAEHARHTADHRTAGTRAGDTSARDGSDGGQHPRSSTDPTATRGGATRTHPGVDVTM